MTLGPESWPLEWTRFTQQTSRSNCNTLSCMGGGSVPTFVQCFCVIGIELFSQDGGSIKAKRKLTSYIRDASSVAAPGIQIIQQLDGSTRTVSARCALCRVIAGGQYTAARSTVSPGSRDAHDECPRKKLRRLSATPGGGSCYLQGKPAVQNWLLAKHEATCAGSPRE